MKNKELQAAYKRSWKQRNPEKAKAWSLSNPDKMREYRRKWKAANPAKVKALRHQWLRNDPEKAKDVNRRAWLLRRERYATSRNAGLALKAGREKPSICELPSCGRKARIAFDHCHGCETFRGWLCQGCNAALGLAGDNPERLRRLADYLEKHKCNES